MREPVRSKVTVSGGGPLVGEIDLRRIAVGVGGGGGGGLIASWMKLSRPTSVQIDCAGGHVPAPNDVAPISTASPPGSRATSGPPLSPGHVDLPSAPDSCHRFVPNAVVRVTDSG